MAQCGQQAVGIRALCADAFRDTLYDRIAVRQKVVQIVASEVRIGLANTLESNWQSCG
jgi:hypothetical protein